MSRQDDILAAADAAVRHYRTGILETGCSLQDAHHEAVLAALDFGQSPLSQQTLAYLYVVCRNAVLRFLDEERKHWTDRVILEDEDAVLDPADPEEGARIRLAIRELPELERVAVIFRLAGYTQQETGDVLHCSPRNIRRLVMDGYRRLAA